MYKTSENVGAGKLARNSVSNQWICRDIHHEPNEQAFAVTGRKRGGESYSPRSMYAEMPFTHQEITRDYFGTRAPKQMKEDVLYYNTPHYMYAESESNGTTLNETDEAVYYGWVDTAINNHKFSKSLTRDSLGTESRGYGNLIGRSNNAELDRSTSTTTSNGSRKKGYENDPEVLLRRQKQIDYGKNTIGYERYTELIPKELRTQFHPQTPPKHKRYSRRAWDGLIKLWRTDLHVWDPPESEDIDVSGTLSMTSTESDPIKIEEDLDYEWIKSAIDEILTLPLDEEKRTDPPAHIITIADNPSTKHELNQSSSTTTSTGSQRRGYETDSAVLSRRQKQIDYGKSTIGYDRYRALIPREQRSEHHPKTPPMRKKYSRRAWDGLIKEWRTRLHIWDPPDAKVDSVLDFSE